MSAERMFAASPMDRLKTLLNNKYQSKAWFSSQPARRLYAQVLDQFDENNREYNETIDRLSRQLSELKISSKIDLTLALEKQKKELMAENENAERTENCKLQTDIENLNMHIVCLKRRAGILEDAHQLFSDSVQKSMTLHLETVKTMKLGFDSTIRRLLVLIEGCQEVSEFENASNGLSNQEKLFQGLSPKSNSDEATATLLKIRNLLLAVQSEEDEPQPHLVENTQENPPTDRPISPDIIVVEESVFNSESESEKEEDKETNVEVFSPQTVRNLKRLFAKMKLEDSDC